MLSKEQVKSKKPIKQWKKDLVVFGFMASLTISILNYYVSFLDSPTYLPEVYISFSDNIDKDNYINCTFSLDHDSILAKIRIRGASNSNRPKKGYRLEFYTKKSLLGMREDDDWLLFANYMDNTRMRVKLSFDLWRSLQEMDHDEAILPDSKYVSLFINRDFQGLYLLAEKNDRKLFDLDRELNGVDSGLIFQTKSHTTFKEYEEDRWEQDWPNPEDLKIMEDVLSDLIDFVNNAPDSIFFNDTIGIFSKFNKINVIDFFLFNFFIYHRDFWSKNYFLIRDSAPSKFFLIPWDFDGSFGQYGWVKYPANRNDEDEIRNRNVLYDRLLDNLNFTQDCKDRWSELRTEIWTEDFILNMVSDMYEEIKDVLKVEMSMWKPETVEDEPENKYPDKYIYSTKEFDLDEYIDYLYEWIEDRLEFCDEYFSEL